MSLLCKLVDDYHFEILIPLLHMQGQSRDLLLPNIRLSILHATLIAADGLCGVSGVPSL